MIIVVVHKEIIPVTEFNKITYSKFVKPLSDPLLLFISIKIELADSSPRFILEITIKL